MTFKTIEYMLAILEEGGFSRAAQRLLERRGAGRILPVALAEKVERRRSRGGALVVREGRFGRLERRERGHELTVLLDETQE